MSSSISFAIKSGSASAAKSTKYSEIAADENKIKKARDYGSVSFGFLFSILYLGVATNFYFNVTRVEEMTRNNCTAMHATTLEWNLQNFCDHVVTWKTCAILGMIVPGLLYMILGILAMYQLSNKQNEEGQSESSSKPSCQKLWSTYDFLTKVVSIAITCVLLTSKAHSTVIGSSSGLKIAAIMYLVVVGSELISIVISVIIGLAFGLCACTLVCCCCCKFCKSGKHEKKDAPESEKNIETATV